MPKIHPFSLGNIFKEFHSLSAGQKTGTIILSALAALVTLGIAFAPVFKSLVNRFNKLNANHLTQESAKANRVGGNIAPFAFVNIKEPFASSTQFEYDRPPSPAKLELTAKERAFFKTEHVSPSTQGALSRLSNDLQIILPKKSLSSTIDNGDCFFDAFAQGLSKILKCKISHQELREIVSRYAQATVWPRDFFGKGITSGTSYQHWKNNIKKDFSGGYSDALWGDPKLDGKILSMHFNVRMRLISEAYYSDASEGLWDETNRDFDDMTFTWKAEGQPEPKDTVILANYPGHYLVVL